MQQAFISHCVNINKFKNYEILVYIDDLHKDNFISSLDEYTYNAVYLFLLFDKITNTFNQIEKLLN